MASTKIHKFTLGAVWIDGVTLAGSVNEIELPELSWDTVDHETIALPGTPQFASKLEAMECTITWASYSPELAAAAANPFRSFNLQVRGNVAEYSGASKTDDKLLKIELSGRFLNNAMGTFSPGEMERESMLAVDKIREVWDGVETLAVSINPPIWRVNGVDLYANVRANLGL